MKKKFLSILMAAAMAMSMAVPAFAASSYMQADDDEHRIKENEETSFTIEMAGAVYSPVLRVQVQSGDQQVYVNPSKCTVQGKYETFYTSDGLEAATDFNYKFEGQSVISTPIVIRSDSDTALTVNASVTPVFAKGVTPVAEADLSDGGKYLAEDASASVKATKAVFLTVKGTAANLTDESLIATALTKGGDAAVTDPKNPTTFKTVCALAAANDDGDVTPQYGAVVVTGLCNPNADWTENDTVGATVVLTFSGEAPTTTP